MGVGLLCRRLDFSTSHFAREAVCHAQSDVLGNRQAEEDRLLLHQAELLTQRLHVPLACVHSVHSDGTTLARVQLIGTHGEQHERALAGTARADNAHALAGCDVEREAPEHRLLATRRVRERHILEGDGETT